MINGDYLWVNWENIYIIIYTLINYTYMPLIVVTANSNKCFELTGHNTMKLVFWFLAMCISLYIFVIVRTYVASYSH